jgi:hypothetical protein
MSNPSPGPCSMLDSGPCDETKVLGWQSPHMRLTYVATPGMTSDRPASRHHSSTLHANPAHQTLPLDNSPTI